MGKALTKYHLEQQISQAEDQVKLFTQQIEQLKGVIAYSKHLLAAFEIPEGGVDESIKKQEDQKSI